MVGAADCREFPTSRMKNAGESGYVIFAENVSVANETRNPAGLIVVHLDNSDVGSDRLAIWAVGDRDNPNRKLSAADLGWVYGRNNSVPRGQIGIIGDPSQIGWCSPKVMDFNAVYSDDPLLCQRISVIAFAGGINHIDVNIRSLKFSKCALGDFSGFPCSVGGMCGGRVGASEKYNLQKRSKSQEERPDSKPQRIFCGTFFRLHPGIIFWGTIIFSVCFSGWAIWPRKP